MAAAGVSRTLGAPQPEEAEDMPSRHFAPRGGYFVWYVNANWRRPPLTVSTRPHADVCPPTWHFSTKKRPASRGFASRGQGRLVLKAGGRAHGRMGGGAAGRSTGPPQRRAPARHGPQPAPTATYFRHGLHEAFFVFRNSEPFHLVVGGTSQLAGEWAPLLCHRLRDFLVEAGRKKSQQHPKGFPGGPPPQY